MINSMKKKYLTSNLLIFLLLPFFFFCSCSSQKDTHSLIEYSLSDDIKGVQNVSGSSKGFFLYTPQYEYDGKNDEWQLRSVDQKIPTWLHIFKSDEFNHSAYLSWDTNCIKGDYNFKVFLKNSFEAITSQTFVLHIIEDSFIVTYPSGTEISSYYSLTNPVILINISLSSGFDLPNDCKIDVVNFDAEGMDPSFIKIDISDKTSPKFFWKKEECTFTDDKKINFNLKISSEQYSIDPLITSVFSLTITKKDSFIIDGEKNFFANEGEEKKCEPFSLKLFSQEELPADSKISFSSVDKSTEIPTWLRINTDNIDNPYIFWEEGESKYGTYSFYINIDSLSYDIHTKSADLYTVSISYPSIKPIPSEFLCINDKKQLIGFNENFDPSDKEILECNTLSIPSEVKSVAEDAFNSNGWTEEKDKKYHLIPENILIVFFEKSSECNLISNRSFENSSYIKFLDLTNCDKLTKINELSFANCKNLYNVDFNQSLDTIKTSAFYGCSNLHKMIFPNKLETIEQNCFYNCTNIIEAFFPKSIKDIGNSAFKNCKSLKYMQFEEFDSIPVWDKYSYNVFAGVADKGEIKILKTPPEIDLNDILNFFVSKGLPNNPEEDTGWKIFSI